MELQTQNPIYIYANIPSDHYPLITTFRFKLKGIHRFSKTREKYAECSEEQREALNEEIKYLINNKDTELSYDDLKDILNAAKEKHMPRIYAKGNNIGISEATMDLIKEREQQILYEQYEEAKITYKKIQHSKKTRQNNRSTKNTGRRLRYQRQMGGNT